MDRYQILLLDAIRFGHMPDYLLVHHGGLVKESVIAPQEVNVAPIIAAAKTLIKNFFIPIFTP